MPGTYDGGKKAEKENKKLHPDFYKIIGRMGQKARKTKVGGFKDKEFASEMGKLGGAKSKRGKAKPKHFKQELGKALEEYELEFDNS